MGSRARRGDVNPGSTCHRFRKMLQLIQLACTNQSPPTASPSALIFRKYTGKQDITHEARRFVTNICYQTQKETKVHVVKMNCGHILRCALFFSACFERRRTAQTSFGVCNTIQIKSIVYISHNPATKQLHAD